jgi:hypothetical protein
MKFRFAVVELEHADAQTVGETDLPHFLVYNVQIYSCIKISEVGVRLIFCDV